MLRQLFFDVDLSTRPVLRAVFNYKYSITLGLILLAHILLVPLASEAVLFAPFILLCLYLAGFLLMGDRSRLCRVILAVGLTALLLTGANIFLGHPVLLATAVCCHAAFLGLLIALLLGRLLHVHKMPFDTVMAGVIIFLLMAGLWSQLYGLILLYDPLAIHAPESNLGQHPYFVTLYYFSVTTLTTAGLGDVTPVSNIARMLTAYESLLGQVYLVVFIALLMGRHFANR